ncbi:LysR family transcriptional regulator [Streptomyces sp. NPDC046909]|uniref:LysR family transcriptional regulator n=1 Tax=Streptomyces sp. NPDC046909 TaxID=3155617 RepID=UPI0033F51767
MNVELRHLRAIAAIGDEGTITGAAASLHVSQPALSRTLEQLEDRLGTRLVNRTTRQLSLTAAGHTLYERAHRILNELDDALSEVVAGRQPLRIGFTWAALGDHTVPLLQAWRAQHPELPVQLQRRSDPDTALRRGEIDAAIVRTSDAVESEVLSAVLFTERRLAAVSENSPLAERSVVRLADLADQLVALCASAGASVDLWSSGRQPRTFEAANVDEWLTTIALEEAVGVTAEATEHSHPHPGIRYIPLADASPVTVRLIWPRKRSHPSIPAFLLHVRHMANAAEPWLRKSPPVLSRGDLSDAWPHERNAPLP